MLVNSQPHVACFLICNHELYGSDRPNFGTIVERIKNGIDWYVSDNYYANLWRMVITQMLAIKQIWLKVKSAFKLTISILIICQLIDNFYLYLAIKKILKNKKKPARMGKIIATALYRYPPISKSNLISTISKAGIQYQVINQNQLSCHLSWSPLRTL